MVRVTTKMDMQKKFLRIFLLRLFLCNLRLSPNFNLNKHKKRELIINQFRYKQMGMKKLPFRLFFANIKLICVSTNQICVDPKIPIIDDIILFRYNLIVYRYFQIIKVLINITIIVKRGKNRLNLNEIRSIFTRVNDDDYRKFLSIFRIL